jgi:hypothetical protein
MERCRVVRGVVCVVVWCVWWYVWWCVWWCVCGGVCGGVVWAASDLVDRMRHSAVAPILVDLAQLRFHARTRPSDMTMADSMPRPNPWLRHCHRFLLQRRALRLAARTHLLRPKVGRADGAREARFVAPREAVPQGGLLPRLKVARAPMRLHELELVAPHASERLAARRLEGRARKARRVHGQLRADDAARRVRARTAELAEEGLGAALKGAGSVAACDSSRHVRAGTRTRIRSQRPDLSPVSKKKREFLLRAVSKARLRLASALSS